MKTLESILSESVAQQTDEGTLTRESVAQRTAETVFDIARESVAQQTRESVAQQTDESTLTRESVFDIDKGTVTAFELDMNRENIQFEIRGNNLELYSQKYEIFFDDVMTRHLSDFIGEKDIKTVLIGRQEITLCINEGVNFLGVTIDAPSVDILGERVYDLNIDAVSIAVCDYKPTLELNNCRWACTHFYVNDVVITKKKSKIACEEYLLNTYQNKELAKLYNATENIYAHSLQRINYIKLLHQIHATFTKKFEISFDQNNYYAFAVKRSLLSDDVGDVKEIQGGFLQKYRNKQTPF